MDSTMRKITKREAILATSARLFAGKGYSQTTTSEIAREAEVAEGTLYHHFGSKDGIFLTLIDETMGGFLAGIEEILDGNRSGRECLSTLIHFLFGYVSRHRERYLIILRDFPAHLASEQSAEGTRHRAKSDRITTLFSLILARGKSDGTLHLPFPVRETAEMLRGSFFGTIRLKMLDLIQTPFPQSARMMETYWLKAFEPERATQKSRRKS
jgi:TetR/AcrR family fatty acid metabolism transcriptional regulator